MTDLLAIDRSHVWHPYASVTHPNPTYLVESADGVYLNLKSGERLIDGMSSWWCVIHGYNHPVLNEALTRQSQQMAHVMFGGLTHEPAIQLVNTLVDITPDSLNKVFLSDSGSVSVEVAIKMAIQYWAALGKPSKHRMLALRSGYHGDTFAAMSVCDPVTGMHHLFNEVLPKQIFIDQPQCRYGESCTETHLTALKQALETHHHEIAAFIVEPVVQGAGGMYFYSPEFLQQARVLCDAYDVLFVFDEIATGFGRTGELFAMDLAGVTPDILCVGKSLTGGYMTLAATLTNDKVANGICNNEPGAFMHGPTFMGNPLACAVANASIELLLSQPWKSNIQRIEQGLKSGLAPCEALSSVKEVRCLGAIGVVEMKEAVDMLTITEQFIANGIWVRPFGKLVYLMPPFIISDEQLADLTNALLKTLRSLYS